MNNTEKPANALEDFKINVKLKIASLWTAVMFCYVYGDIFVLQEPGHLKDIIAGTVWYGKPLSQGRLLSFAISMAIPSVMIFLSVALTPKINRWTNIVLGLFSSAFVVLILAMTQGLWSFYIFLSAVETVLTLLVVWYAWNWPKQSEK